MKRPEGVPVSGRTIVGTGGAEVAPPVKRPKPASRAQRWADAAGRAQAALEELKDIQSEFEEWRDNVPENLQSSSLYEKLEAVCDLDIEGAVSTVEEAASVDLPLGFGRD